MAAGAVTFSSKKVVLSKTTKTTVLSSNPTGHTYMKPEKSTQMQAKEDISIHEVMKAMGAKDTSSLKEIKKTVPLESTTVIRRPSTEILRFEESSRGPTKLRHLRGSMAVNLTGIKQPSSPTKLPGGLRAVEKVTKVRLKMKSANFLGRETTNKREARLVWKLPERVFLRSSEQNKIQQLLPNVRYPKFGGKKLWVDNRAREVQRAESREKEEEVKTRLTTHDKAMLTTASAKKAAAQGARQVLTAINAMRDTEANVTLATRRHAAAMEKLRGPIYAAEKIERVTELEEEAEKMLEVKEPVDVQGYAARLAHFGGGFGPEIYNYHAEFDASRARVERLIAERCGAGLGERKRGGKVLMEKSEPKWDSWDIRKRGELKAGFKIKDVKENKRLEKLRKKREMLLKKIEAKIKRGEKFQVEKMEVEEEETPESDLSDVCPGRVCERGPCRKPRPLPPRHQRDFPDFPQYNTCVCVGNWVEERCCYVKKPHAQFSIYSFDYRKPVPPLPYTKCPYYANMFSHRGLPYDVLFTHGALPPPRRWTTECKPPCEPCCQKISCRTETRDHYVAPPKSSYVTCRYATPKALSSSYEPISRNIWNLHLRGDQLRMVPTMPCG